jgi:hypothetical protein
VDWDEGGDEFEVGITEVSPSRSGWVGAARASNPKPARTPAPSITGGTGSGGTPQVGDTLSYDSGCEGAYTEWRLTDNTTGGYAVVSSGVAATYIVASEAAAANKTIVAVGKCPDPSAPDGYGPEIVSAPASVVVTGFIGFTTGGRYQFAEIADNDTIVPYYYNVFLAATNVDNVGVVTSITEVGGAQPFYTIGQLVDISNLGFTTIVSNTRKHAPGIPTIYLQLS